MQVNCPRCLRELPRKVDKCADCGEILSPRPTRALYFFGGILYGAYSLVVFFVPEATNADTLLKRFFYSALFAGLAVTIELWAFSPYHALGIWQWIKKLIGPFARLD